MWKKIFEFESERSLESVNKGYKEWTGEEEDYCESEEQLKQWEREGFIKFEDGKCEIWEEICSK